MSSRNEFKLAANGDLYRDETGSLVRVEDVSQRLKTRLQFFLGEWFLDTSAGTPYLQTILGQGRASKLNHIRTALRARAAETVGVLSVERVTLQVDTVARKLTATIFCTADNGDEISVSVGG